VARKPVGASTVYDAIIIGLGGMGSAAAAELAARGRRVLGIERFSPAHDRGSSHGGSRIIRQAYFEDPAYVPLLLRAYERWRELEAAAGVSLLTETGGLMIGPPTSRTVAGSVASARQWELDHELLSADEVARRWPTFMPARDDVALYEPRAGFVRPEATVAAQVELARGFGAQLRFGEPVLGWEVSDGGVEVTTDRDRYRAARLVLAPGAWAPQVMARFGLPLTVERHVQFWLRSRVPIERFAPARHPIYIWEDHAGTQVYGFPALGGAAEGVKAAFFRRGVSTTADELQRGVAPGEAVPLLDFLSTRLPALGPGVCAAVACLYTTAPDEHFVLGSVGGYERVVICSPCSGHGFKFVPVIGEMVADLVEFGGTRFDISRFDPARFAPASGTSAHHDSI
jgi:sarcosine oxidase